MNHTYRLIWSPRFGALVPVAENAGSVSAKSAPRRRSGRGRAGPGGLARLAGLARALALALGLTPVAVMALPAGGHVAHGQAKIHKSGSSLTVDQASQKAIINWQRFGIGKKQSVTFHQPGASSVALNRVVGSDPSAIYGALTANGQLFLVNPNGILFAPGSAVDVGGLVASTLGISNSHFLSGHYTFSGPSTAGVVNKGRIKTAQGGYVAFIGNQVDNEGAIDTPGGTTALGAGARVHLTLAGDSLLSFDVSQSALAAAAKNGGLIQAKGGQVILSAAAKNAALRTVVNNTGVVRAEGVAKHGGVIKLMGGNSGTTHVAGTLDAKSSDGGAAGTIETSGHHLKIADAKVSAGPGGQWLLDPVDLTIGSNAAAAISAALNSNTSVTEETTKTSNASSGSTNSGTTASGSNQPGNINVDAKIQWSTGAKLTLSAYHSVNVNAPIIASGSNAALAVVFDNNQGGTSSGGSFNVNKPVTLSGSGAGFSLNGTPYTVIQSMAGLQAMGSNLSGDYVLGKNLTDTNSSGSGFSPVGTSNSNQYSGKFDGLQHTISDLYINRGSANYVGLFGFVGSNATIRNVGVIHANITGAKYSGPLVGFNRGTLANDFASGNVTGSSNVGGLAGYNLNGSLYNDYAKSAVNGSNAVGGLVGYNYTGTIETSYASGNVNGGNYVGGLVGYDYSGWITNDYAIGNVSGNANIGGLLGSNYQASISTLYATGSVSGSSNVGALVGRNNYGTISNGYWDTNTAGVSKGVGTGSNNGVTGRSTANLAASLPSGFSSAVWGDAGGNTTPYLLSHADLKTTGPVLLGTESGASPNPYHVILNMAQLQDMNRHRSYNYVLGTNLTDTVTSGSGLSPIGSNSNKFNGTFSGLNHTISDLYINRLSNSYVGLFGSVGSNGVVKNLTLKNVNITGGGDSGALAGASDGEIQNVHVSGSVNSTSNTGVGGLVGINQGILKNSYATDSVSETNGLWVGGLAGANGGRVVDSYATGRVSATGALAVGGLVGSNRGYIFDAYATGQVSGSRSIGGLVGTNYGHVSNDYSAGSVSGKQYVGGLIGTGFGNTKNAYAAGAVSGNKNIGGLYGTKRYGTNSKTYAIGKVSGSTNVGGVIGSNAGSNTISDAYWDTNSTGVSQAVGTGASTGISGLSTAKLSSNLPSGFSSSFWGNAGGQTTPYLLDHARFNTTGPVLLGSEGGSNPATYHVILNMAQLQAMKSNLSGRFVLGENLQDTVNSGSGFTPVGTGSNPFTGVFDGLGFTISNLYLNNSNAPIIGLFGMEGANGVIRNVGLIDPDYTIHTSTHSIYLGGLVGFQTHGAKIDRSYAKGGQITVKGGGSGVYVGGLVGISARSSLSHSHASDSVLVDLTNATQEDVGGLAGVINGSSKDNYANGKVTVQNAPGATSDVGGLAGMVYYGSVSNSYASGQVSVTGSGHASSNSYVGGLAGLISNHGAINNAYAIGNVSVGGSNYIKSGGLTGKNLSNASINNAYAMNDVTDSFSGTSAAAVAYNNQGSLKNVYWDTNDGQAAVARGSATGTHGLSDTQTRQQSAYPGLDFNSPVWVIYNGHTRPLLNAFLTPLIVSAGNVSHTYTGLPSTLGLANPSYSVASAPGSGQLYGLAQPYDKAVNVGTYKPDLWSGQQGYRISYSGAKLTINPKAIQGEITGDPTKIADGNADITLQPSDISLNGFTSGQGVTLSDISGKFASSAPGQNIPISATLGSRNFTSLPGTRMSNYILPSVIQGYGVIKTRVSATQTSAQASAVNTLSSAAGADDSSNSSATLEPSEIPAAVASGGKPHSPHTSALSIKDNGVRSKQIACSGGVSLDPFAFGSMADLCFTH